MTQNHVTPKVTRKSGQNDAVSPSYLPNGVLGVSKNQSEPRKKIYSKNTMKNRVRNGHKNANFPHIREKA